MFLVEGLNTDDEQVAKIRDAIAHIQPDKIHLNTAVRPTAEPGIKRPDTEKLRTIAAGLGQNCEVVVDFSRNISPGHGQNRAEYVLSMLKRRPCSLNDICSGLGLARNEALKYLGHLQQQGLVAFAKKDGIIFYSSLICKDEGSIGR